MKESERTPGYSYRRLGAERIEEQSLENLHKYDVHGDGERGIPVRTARAEDARIATEKARKTRKNTPFK